MNRWTQKNIFKADLTKMSHRQLWQLWDKHERLQSYEYAFGVAIPILDFQKFSFVENNLVKFLKEKAPKDQYSDYYAIFTEPIYNSFAQDQEADLLKLMTQFYGKKKWRDDVMEKNLDYLRSEYLNFIKLLHQHTRKHCWVYYVYNGPEFTEDDFLGFIRDYLIKNINPNQELKKLALHRKELVKKQKEYIELLKPDKFNLAILKLAGKLIWGKPRRKDYQSKSYYHVKKLQQEVAKRLFLSLEQVRSMPYEMVKSCLINKKEPDVSIINEINKFHICLPNDDGSIAVLHGQEAKEFYKKVKRSDQPKEIAHTNKIKGACACKGKARGSVKIINVLADMRKMDYGDILVSTATTPSIVPAMKKAAAIVTDEGGLSCHAAIVSRELKTPCVIGTKIATKILKDGDRVEVDATKGIVSKL
ncbi:hypothetical protein KKG41_04115 [Patescibacteria group bacterium]|nr:hypothetical protein [Patescibacteria group bacterium]MBU1891141.1 hypothetical protein [Patescibacteria group bacterium]